MWPCASREFRGYSGTRTAPAIAQPRTKSAHPNTLSSSPATRSPGRTPIDRSPFASRTPVPRLGDVSAPSSVMTAVKSPLNAAAWRMRFVTIASISKWLYSKPVT